MGAVESSATEETGVIRFVDSVNISHEKEGQDYTSTDFVREEKDWTSHLPKTDETHGLATVAPADTMLHEGTYEDFEILGDTAVRQS